jgi:hypothetical protein
MKVRTAHTLLVMVRFIAHRSAAAEAAGAARSAFTWSGPCAVTGRGREASRTCASLNVHALHDRDRPVRHHPQHGHIVVRVEPGGGKYRVFVLDETTSEATVVSVHGPYQSR